MKSSILNLAQQQRLLARLQALTPQQVPQWGTMNASEMLCHLSDQIRGAIGLKPAQDRSTFFYRTIAKWIFFTGWIRMPKKFQTAKEWDVKLGGGTAPSNFEQDKQQLVQLFAQFEQASQLQPHPFFGVLTRPQWAMMIYEHIDYHFQQFGI